MVEKLDQQSFARWRANPIAFIEEVLRDPENGEPFVLNPAERAFLALAFQLDANGRLEPANHLRGRCERRRARGSDFRARLRDDADGIDEQWLGWLRDGILADPDHAMRISRRG